MTNTSKPLGTPAGRNEYYERLRDRNLAPLWEFFKDWFTTTPQVRSQPYLWSYAGLRPLILESAAVVDHEEAERRVLVLENPGLEGRRLATESLYAGLQLIMPGEIAPCHRHSPAALRFIIEGKGAYTAVNGEKAYMEPGDFIVTPSWTWHEHGHEGEGPMVWLDVLDVAVIHLFNATFTEHMPEKTYPRAIAPGRSLYRYGMNMLPVGYVREGASPIFNYPYSRSREALDRLKRLEEWDACHGLKMAYIDPTSGDAAIPTISTFIQLLPAGFATSPYRSTAGVIHCVVEGRGTVVMRTANGECRLDYAPWDLFVVPSWQSYVVEALEETVLFGASDEIIQKKLGIFRESRG